MEYREQLEYIKAHGQREDDDERNRKGRKGKRKRKKLSFLDKFFWMILFLVSILFVVFI